jgi:hypothetical protein
VEVDGVIWSYAAICNWTGGDHGLRAEVLDVMRATGTAITGSR